ncbi:M48 metallopeptidase family protein [Rhodanobacter soli]|uniref:Metal-dependent hydrolase n=1 Tax=Rhodanobacter soli TaxID=590609 RepID=A0ABV2PVP4_9GAMM
MARPRPNGFLLHASMTRLPPMRLQAMKTQWGSCSPTGKITLNLWLLKAPRDYIDYVIFHELCYLKEHNHSPRLFKLLYRHVPTWRQRKA